MPGAGGTPRLGRETNNYKGAELQEEWGNAFISFYFKGCTTCPHRPELQQVLLSGQEAAADLGPYPGQREALGWQRRYLEPFQTWAGCCLLAALAS